jgi:hypothetical protein
MFTAIALICIVGVEPIGSNCAVSVNTEYFYVSQEQCHQAVGELSAKGAFNALIVGEKTYLADHTCVKWFGII